MGHSKVLCCLHDHAIEAAVADAPDMLSFGDRDALASLAMGQSLSDDEAEVVKRSTSFRNAG